MELPQQPVLHPVGHQQDASHRREGQLKPDVGGGKGVGPKQQKQSQRQGGGTVPFPVQQGRELEQQDHHRRPEHRRGIARDAAEQHHPEDGEDGGAPSAPPQQGGEQSGQKGQVHPGHRHRVAQPRPLQGGGELVGEAVPVARHQGLDKAGNVLREGGVDALLQRPGRPGGEILGRDVVRTLHLQPAIGRGPEENALGGVVGNGLPGKGAVPQGTVGDGLHSVAGTQVRPLLVHIEDGGHLRPLLRVRPDQDGIAAVGPLLGPVGHRGGEADGAVVQLLGGLEEHRHVQRRPQEARRQAGQNEHRPGPGPALPPDQQPQQQCYDNQRPAQRQQKGVQAAVDGEENSGGKGEGKGGQYAHSPPPSPSVF